MRWCSSIADVSRSAKLGCGGVRMNDRQAICGALKQWINSIDTTGLIDGQMRAALGGDIVTVPPVAGEGEGLRCGSRADVEVNTDIGCSIDNQVSLDAHIATGYEAVGSRLLEDAEDPLAGMVNGVVGESRAVYTDECDGCGAAGKAAVVDGDGPGLIFRVGRAEIGHSGRSSAVDRSLTGVDKVTSGDADVGRSALGLNTGGLAEPFLTAKGALLDDALMAPDQVDPAATPAFDRTAGDPKARQSRQLDPVNIALRADILDIQPLQHDPARRGVHPAAVVTVEPVASLPARMQVAKRDIRASGKLDCRAASFKDGWIGWVGRFNYDGLLRGARAIKIDSAAIGAWCDTNGCAWLDGLQSIAQGRVICHGDLAGLSRIHQ